MIHQANATATPEANIKEGAAEDTQCLPSQVRQYIESNPTASVAIGLGIGFGAGLVVSSLLRGSSDNWARERSLAERIGNQMADSLSGVLPSSWKDHLRS